MPTIPQYTVWLGVLIFQILALYIFIKCGQLARFWPLYLYFGLDCIVSASRFVILRHYGLRSTQYAYFYYHSDAILTLSLAILVTRLFAFACKLKTWQGIPLRIVVPGLAGVAIFSYGVVHQSEAKLLTRLAVEFSQDLYFALLFLAIVGWIAILVRKLRPSAEVNLVWVLFIYFSFIAALYSIGNLHSAAYAYREVMGQLAGLWFVAGSAFSVLSDDPRFS